MWRIFIVFLIVCLTNIDAELIRSWEYTLISSYSNCSHEGVSKVDMKVVRIKRGEYAINGTLDLYVPLTNDYTVTIDSYYSKTGVGFTKLPFGFSKIPYNEYMDLGYKPFVMESIKECSNFSQYVGRWKGPQLPDRYWFNKCKIDLDRIPPMYLRGGYYKIQAEGENAEKMIKIFIEILVKVDQKYEL